MGDERLICPVQVYKIIPMPPGVPWVSRDQRLNAKKKRNIGFMLILSVKIVKSAKRGIFLVYFRDFPLFLKDYLVITRL